MRFYYWIIQQILLMLFAVLFKLRIFGRDNVPLAGPLLLVSNHQSYLDPILCGVGLKRELDYMARNTLFTNKLFGKLIRSLNAFPLQRDSADIKALKDIINRLKSGRAVIIFPEGTRTNNGRIMPVKSGFDVIARRAGAATVPMVIDGAFEVWPRQQKLPGLGNIRVKYGKAITAEECQKMSRDDFIAEVTSQLRILQNELRREYGKGTYEYG